MSLRKMSLTVCIMFDILLHKGGEIDMSDRGSITLKAFCQDGLDARAVVELVESLGEVKEGARVGVVDPNPWLVEATIDECDGENFEKLTNGFREIKFVGPCKVSVEIWQESMQDFYDIFEGTAGEELTKSEESYSEPPTERAAKWTKTEEQVLKWYTFEEFKDIPENMLV